MLVQFAHWRHFCARLPHHLSPAFLVRERRAPKPDFDIFAHHVLCGIFAPAPLRDHKILDLTVHVTTTTRVLLLTSEAYPRAFFQIFQSLEIIGDIYVSIYGLILIGEQFFQIPQTLETIGYM